MTDTERPTTWGAVTRWPCCEHCGGEGGGCSGVHSSPCAHRRCPSAWSRPPEPGGEPWQWVDAQARLHLGVRVRDGIGGTETREEGCGQRWWVPRGGAARPMVPFVCVTPQQHTAVGDRPAQRTEPAPTAAQRTVSAGAFGWTDPAIVRALTDPEPDTLGERPELPARLPAPDRLRYCDTCTVWGTACSEHRGAHARPLDQVHTATELSGARELGTHLTLRERMTNAAETMRQQPSLARVFPETHVHRVTPPEPGGDLRRPLYAGHHPLGAWPGWCHEHALHQHRADGSVYIATPGDNTIPPYTLTLEEPPQVRSAAKRRRREQASSEQQPEDTCPACGHPGTPGHECISASSYCQDCGHALGVHTPTGCGARITGLGVCVCQHPWDERDWHDRRTYAGAAIWEGSHTGCSRTDHHVHTALRTASGSFAGAEVRPAPVYPRMTDQDGTPLNSWEAEQASSEFRLILRTPCCAHTLGEHTGPDGCTECACPYRMRPVQDGPWPGVCSSCQHLTAEHGDGTRTTVCLHEWCRCPAPGGMPHTPTDRSSR